VIALREIAEGMITPELLARETEIEAEEELAASFETPIV
jgi:DNA-directed RNA polymerase subunit omega